MTFRARPHVLLTTVALLSATLMVLTPSPGEAVDPTQITITSSSGDPNRTGDFETSYAHDGNVGTNTYTTPSSNTQNPSYLQFFFASSTVNRLRILKDVEYGPHNLTIETINSADAVPAWTNVSGLTNGFEGGELLNATAVNTNGTVTGDAQTYAEGFASLTFNPVTATGLRIGFNNPVSCCQHYKVYEFELFNTAEADPPVVGVVRPNGGEVWARGVPHQIKWFNANPGDTTVRIVLLKAGKYLTRIANPRPTSDGVFSWTPSNSLTPATNYKIRIVVNGTTINDVSNANFRLT